MSTAPQPFAPTDHPSVPGSQAPTATDLTTVRRAGVLVAVTGALWVPTLLSYDSGDPAGALSRSLNLAGLVFQVGLFVLLLTMARTRATGDRLGGRLLLRIEMGVLAVAGISTVLTTVFPFDSAPGWVLALDLGWPLSMLGLLPVAICTAVVGRWRGALRFWPLLGGAWFLVAMATSIVLGEDTVAGGVVVGAWTAAAFAGLGILLAARPRLTGVTR